jgi:hypothetical protein
MSSRQGIDSGAIASRTRHGGLNAVTVTGVGPARPDFVLKLVSL